jgi:hypothetical protein
MKFLTFLKTKFDHIFNGQFSNNQDIVKEEINREIEKASVKLGQLFVLEAQMLRNIDELKDKIHAKERQIKHNEDDLKNCKDEIESRLLAQVLIGNRRTKDRMNDIVLKTNENIMNLRFICSTIESEIENAKLMRDQIDIGLTSVNVRGFSIDLNKIIGPRQDYVNGMTKYMDTIDNQNNISEEEIQAVLNEVK